MKKWLLSLLLVLLAAPAWAAPALWHVKGPKGDAWLLGSIHVLPPDLPWLSRTIARAVARSDTFVFEVPLNEDTQAKAQELIRSRGLLPPGQTLRDLLPPASRDNFDAVVASSGLDPNLVGRERPWLAGLQLTLAQAARMKFATDAGVDASLMAEAAKSHRPTRYLETVEQQFRVIIPDDTALELEQFESDLKDLSSLEGKLQPLVDAWMAGDQKALDTLINGEMDAFPAARKALLDDRNQNWVPQIEKMLEERHTYFITVGAGHLAGEKGVPALLRKAGYKVTGP